MTASRTVSMTTPEIEQLTADCAQLRVTKIAATLPTLLEDAAAQDLSYSAFLSSVLRTEVASKQEKHHRCVCRWRAFRFRRRSTASTGRRSPRSSPR